LSEYGIHVPDKNRTFEWVIIYDFEKRMEKPRVTKQQNTDWKFNHIPVSVAVISNVPDFTQVFTIVDPKPNSLIKLFVEYLERIQKRCFHWQKKSGRV